MLCVFEEGYVFVCVCLWGVCNYENNIIDFIYYIEEGFWVYIECINILGNDWMCEYVICWEFDVVEGDVFN